MAAKDKFHAAVRIALEKDAVLRVNELAINNLLAGLGVEGL